MGTVLAMTRHARFPVLRIAALAGALLVAGCSTDPNSPLSQITEQAARVLPGQRQATAAPIDVRNLTRADIAGETLPLMRVTLGGEDGSAAALALAAENRGVETWVTGNQVSVLLDGPVLFGTRGLGPDLITAETAPTRALLAAGRSGEVTRALRRLDGNDDLVPVTFRCTLRQQGSQTIEILQRRHVTRRAVETCIAPDGTRFENVYWIGDGVLWQSRQWVGDRIGYMTTERLIR